jgi:TATA-box binding protein (TBP) (component of TFIID and TFIIIB)
MEYPTQYKVSTITVVSRVCMSPQPDRNAFDLAEAFPSVKLGCAESNKLRVCTSKYGTHIRIASDGSMCCGVPCCRHRVPKKPRNQKPTKIFGNQITLVSRLDDHPDVGSIKLFANGRIHLTGARTVENAETFVREVSKTLRSVAGQIPGTLWIDPMEEFQVCMINSNCDLGFEVNRPSLVQYMTRNFPGISISYDPCMYPGVQIKFLWNAAVEMTPNGQGTCRCLCAHQGIQRCTGKGRGDAIGSCRKVTISVFQTGQVILTGAQSMQQLDDAYAFVVSKLAVEPFRKEIALIKRIYP